MVYMQLYCTLAREEWHLLTAPFFLHQGDNKYSALNSPLPLLWKQ